jgi:transcriptional regulator with XRE-family HTH domain
MAKAKQKQSKEKTKTEIVDVETLGGRLRAFRLEMACTVDDFSSEVMLDSDELLQIENGSKEPTINQLFEIAVGMNCDLHYLITGRPSDLYCRAYIVYPKNARVTIEPKYKR